jgi:hypothetical protein
MQATNLHSELEQFTGTEQYYRPSLFSSMRVTDGVKYFIDQAGAYWFTDIVATEIMPKFKKYDFVTVQLVALDSEAKIVAYDGDNKRIFLKKIGYTDCPDGEYNFFMQDGGNFVVMMLPSEY